MAALGAALQTRGLTTVLTREPGGTPVGDALREIFLRRDLRPGGMAELLLINASRSELVREVIRPALARGSAVLCDRYVHSSLAYQGYGRGVPLDLVRTVCNDATGGLMPDLTLYVDISTELSVQRVHERAAGHDRMELQDAAFFERVRTGYLELARGDSRIVVLDGSRPAEEVAAAALRELNEKVPL